MTDSPEPADRLPGPGGAWVAGIIVVAITLLSTFTIVDPERVENTDVAADRAGLDFGPIEEQATDAVEDAGPIRRRVTEGGSEGSFVEGQAGTREAGEEQGGQGPGQGPQASYDCDKGENAGASDIGVTANEIRLGATVVRTGIARDFLADAQFGIEAVIQKANREGGICNRRLVVSYEDDEWLTDRGQRIIEKWIGGKQHFGLIVNPSSEGLRGALDGGLIDSSNFPVVGADGMLVGQYTEPWVWPVATSTYSVMHIMANHAVNELGARNLAIVAETNYRFGVEGLAAFRAEVEQSCKGKTPACGGLKVHEVKGGELSYRNQVNAFIGDCGREFDKCDFVALLLEPSTAGQWVRDGGLGSGDRDRGFKAIGAPQPLFVDSFIRNCKRQCADMLVWTSFKPPIHPFDREPAVQGYRRALLDVSPTADASNPHVQGAYAGAQLFVEALERLGPAPTRAGLRAELDQTTFESGLAPTLKFSEGNHFAAVSAQAFKAIFNGNTFNNWEFAVDFRSDSAVQRDLGLLK